MNLYDVKHALFPISSSFSEDYAGVRSADKKLFIVGRRLLIELPCTCNTSNLKDIWLVLFAGYMRRAKLLTEVTDKWRKQRNLNLTSTGEGEVARCIVIEAKSCFLRQHKWFWMEIMVNVKPVIPELLSSIVATRKETSKTPLWQQRIVQLRCTRLYIELDWSLHGFKQPDAAPEKPFWEVFWDD